MLVNAIESCEELLQNKRHVLACHLEADTETDHVERVDDLVADDGARATARRETRVSGRDNLENGKDDVFKDGLLEGKTSVLIGHLIKFASSFSNTLIVRPRLSLWTQPASSVEGSSNGCRGYINQNITVGSVKPVPFSVKAWRQNDQWRHSIKAGPNNTAAMIGDNTYISFEKHRFEKFRILHFRFSKLRLFFVKTLV